MSISFDTLFFMTSGFTLSGGLGLGLAVVVAAAVIALMLAGGFLAIGVFAPRLGGLCLASLMLGGICVTALIFGRLSVGRLLRLDMGRDLYRTALAAP